MKLGIQTKFSLALLMLALVPLTVTTVVLTWYNLHNLEKSASQYRGVTADATRQQIENLLDQARWELRVVGAALAQRGAPADQRERRAQARLKGGAYVHRVSIFGRSGEHIFTLRSADERDILKRPARLPAALLGSAQARGHAASPPRRTAGGRWRMPLVLPIYQGAERTLFGFAWSDVDLSPLNALVKEISTRRFDRHQLDRVFVVDRRLRVVAHANPAMLGRSIRDRGIAADVASGPGVLGVDVALSADYDHGGEELLGLLQPVPALGLAIVVEQRRSEAYAAVRATWRVALIVGAIFALVALIGGRLAGRLLTDPIAAVSSAAGRIASGDFEAKVRITSNDEVGALARSFNTMASDLKTFQGQLVEETRIRTDLGRYLSAELVDQIASREASLELGGQRREVTVIFADVVAFTPLAEKFPAEKVVAALNELFTLLTEVVFRHGGTVDKFIGDCVMAVFGAPYGHDDDPLRAVRAAEEMLRWVEAGHPRWRKELGRELQLGIGIHTGDAVVGNVGSKKRMEYTVIGDTVNIAARLEALAQPGQVLMTAATWERVKDEFDANSLGAYSLAGRMEKTEVYALEVDG